MTTTVELVPDSKPPRIRITWGEEADKRADELINGINAFLFLLNEHCQHEDGTKVKMWADATKKDGTWYLTRFEVQEVDGSAPLATKLPLGHEFSPYGTSDRCAHRVKHGDIGCTRQCGLPESLHKAIEAHGLAKGAR
jgi:hypothetical protein